jgi:ribonuclease R
MSKKKKSSKKLKNSLSHTVRKVFTQNASSTLNHKQVCQLLDIREGALRKLAFSVLEDLVKNGFLKSAGHGVYQLNASTNFISGRLQMTARGAGFVIPEDKDINDIFVAPHNLNHALDGDVVKVQIIKSGQKRKEGAVIEVVERERYQFVGTIELHDKFAFFIPDNPKVGTDIFIQKDKLNGAKDGDKVLVKIIVWPKSADNPYGEVVEVLGNTNPNDIEMISILVNQGLDYVFPEEVVAQAETVKMELDQNEVKQRRDFRDILTFTIDPLDARDFDDALSIKHLDNGNIEVGVHIADVSHYVKPGTPMDKEAYKRGNSVYLVDRVVPMLPEQLSNMACSLRPNEDKFSFSAVFEMDKEGKIFKQWFGKTVIHSDRRFTYEQAQEIIEGKEDDYSENVLLLDKIAKILRKSRLKAGAMNIESEEVRFRLDDTGFPNEVVIKRSKDAHKLIEEFMLLANRKVATFIANKKEKKIPFVYRCHDKPDPQKVATFGVFIDKFGYDIDQVNVNQLSKNINKLLQEIKETPEYTIIQSMAIRAMAKAIYDVDNVGHYGLAFDFYTHFTSPIRRYADLLVHRILQDELTTGKHSYGSSLDDICKHISRTERKATEAERESTKYFQTLFLIDKIGESFAGTVSGVTDFGLFIKLTENQCEGFVSFQEIPGDRYYFDADKYAIIGRKTGKEITLGDHVQARVYEVNPRKRQIELEIVEFIQD